MLPLFSFCQAMRQPFSVACRRLIFAREQAFGSMVKKYAGLGGLNNYASPFAHQISLSIPNQ